MRPLAERDEPGFEEIRDFVADEAALVPRLESVLARIGQRVRDQASAGLDTSAVWGEVERRLGWLDSDSAPGPEAEK